jgi:glycosyltransferase involved in cell wall biosynthesis
MTPAISVITATLDRRDLTERAVRSVIAQGLDGVEHIVIDGGSRDGTREMLAGFPHLVVIAEPDNSLYEAWNKGVARAGGDLLVILNSDDELPQGAFAAAREAWHRDPAVEMISGPVEIRDEAGGCRLVSDSRILSLREQDVRSGAPFINGRYLARSLLDRVGPFDERWRIVADQDWLMRALLAGVRRTRVVTPLYRYLAHAGSITLRDGARESLAAESLRAAEAGLAGARTPEARAAYARWRAWATFYAAGLAFRRGRLTDSLGTAARAFAADPFWPLRLPAQIAVHLGERGARRGVPCGPGVP